jgi:hypothetical protein
MGSASSRNATVPTEPFQKFSDGAVQFFLWCSKPPETRRITSRLDRKVDQSGENVIKLFVFVTDEVAK